MHYFCMVLLVHNLSAELNKPIILPACSGFTDNRLKPSHVVQTTTESVNVPLTTYILSGSIILRNEETCENVKEETIPLTQSEVQFTEPNPLIQDVFRRTEKHFTREGQYFDGDFYYDSAQGDFCVKSVSESSITVQICKPSCNTTDSISYCVPKCCAPDEIIGYWSGRCRKLTKIEQGWSSKHFTYTENQKLAEIYQRNELDCNNGIKRLPFRNVNGPVQNGSHLFEMKEKIKLEVRNGKLKLLHLSEDRQWKVYDKPFCVDGFVTSPTATYHNEDTESQVAVVCPSMATDVGKIGIEQTLIEAWIYAIVSIIASLFLLAIIFIYLILPEKRNFYGLVVLSYVLSMLFSYILYTGAHFVTLFPNPEFTGLGKRGPICMTIAIGSHYFLFSSYSWLTVLNIDLWRTFKSLHMISPTDKRLKDFTIYSVLAWGLPFLLIASFVTVDEIYRDPITLVVVPDYATSSCSVADWSRGHYVYAPLAIFLLINGILTLLTFCILFRARRNASKLASGGPERYSAFLFLKLFCIMGVFWFFQMVSWYYNGDNKPWIFLILDIIMHLQAVALFCLFCCNERTLQNLQDEYPRCSGLVNTVRNIKAWICCSSTTADGTRRAETKPLFDTKSRNTEYMDMSAN
ncbi:unnamed protein product [Orchesella dallaii]|uniref:G-protein coupled receptors family 2 profile 2 domain-containing protein n=1 Tax=Orchesella dallaii TaxID=48710 RepID=A0ABP1QDF1_9HEXA